MQNKLESFFKSDRSDWLILGMSIGLIVCGVFIAIIPLIISIVFIVKKPLKVEK